MRDAACGPARGPPRTSRTSGGASASRTASTACRGSTTSATPRPRLRFLSVEPLLEDLGRIDLAGIDWVIVGGESGAGARPMDADWVRSRPRPVPGRGRPLLLQAVGRDPQEARGARARRQDPRRDAPLGRGGGHEPRGSPRGHRPGRPPDRRHLTRDGTWRRRSRGGCSRRASLADCLQRAFSESCKVRREARGWPRPRRRGFTSRRGLMKRYLLVLAVGLAGFGPVARAQSPEEWAQTAGFVAAFQNPDGGFAATKGGPSTLGATSSSLRALKYTGGSVPDVLACLAFVRSCYDPETGGFAQTPGGKPDVPTTAVGIMASLEQKNLTDEMATKAAAFLSERAEGFEEIRIAVAGFEGLRKTSPEVPGVDEGRPGRSQSRRHLRQGPRAGEGHRRAGRRVAPDGGGHRASRHRRGRDEGGPAPRRRVVEGRRAVRPRDELPGHAGLLHAQGSPRPRRDPQVHRRLPEVRRRLLRDPGRRRRPERLLLRHHHPGMGPDPRGRAARPRDRRVRPPLQRQGPGRLGGRHEALVGPRRDARGDLARPEAQRLPRDRRELWRLHPEALVPARRRRGQQRRPVPQRAGPGPRDVGLSGRHRRELLGLPVRRVEAQPGPGPGVSQGARRP